MKLKLAAITMFFCLSSIAVSRVLASTELNDLTPLEWKNRIILMDDVPQKHEWVQKLEKYDDQIVDRHIFWFVLTNPVITNYPGKLSSDFLMTVRAQYPFKNSAALLVGKDGEVKERTQELDLVFFNEKIDAMPMRQMEMLRKSKESN